MNAELIKELTATATLVVLVLPVIISLILDTIPPVSDWWASEVSKRWKPTVLLVVCEVIAFAAQLGACTGIDLGLGATCADPNNAQTWVKTALIGGFAWVMSQGGYLLLTRRVHDLIKGISAGVEGAATIVHSVTEFPAKTLEARPLPGEEKAASTTVVATAILPADTFSVESIPYELLTDSELQTIMQNLATEVRKRTIVATSPAESPGIAGR